MAFDLATARQVAAAPGPKSGFDLASAKPVDPDPLSVPDSVPRGTMPAAAPDKGFAATVDEKLQGGMEAGLSVATGALTAIPARVAALVSALSPSNYGSQAGARRAMETGAKIQERGTYQPGPAGREMLEDVGSAARAVGADKLAGMGPMFASEAGILAPPAARQAAKATGAGVKRALAPDVGPELMAPPPVTASSGARAPFAAGGSGAVDMETIRRQRAAELPRPIELTKGQASRDFAQQRFERETAKDAKVGEPLRQRAADQNAAMVNSFDDWIGEIGASAPDRRAAGQAVDTALKGKAARVKGAIDAQYAKAREAGEMAELVPVAPLTDYLAANEAAAVGGAAVIPGVEKAVTKLSKDGQISLNDLAEIRKLAGKLGGKDATNASFAGEIKGVIDSLTDIATGAEFKKARDMHRRFAEEFKDKAAVARLMRNKPGTTDRAVALEDVFQHSILSGSLDDVRAIRRTLQTEGPAGQQAWKEMQGQTMAYLKEQATKGATRDVRGERIVNANQLDKAVKELDRDGKLDFVFGKQGAQQLRNLNELAADAFTSPPGAVNASNTGSVVLEALSKVPGIGWMSKGLTMANNELSARKIRRRVNESLAPSGQIASPPP